MATLDKKAVSVFLYEWIEKHSQNDPRVAELRRKIWLCAGLLHAKKGEVDLVKQLMGSMMGVCVVYDIDVQLSDLLEVTLLTMQEFARHATHADLDYAEQLAREYED